MRNVRNSSTFRRISKKKRNQKSKRLSRRSKRKRTKRKSLNKCPCNSSYKKCDIQCRYLPLKKKKSKRKRTESKNIKKRGGSSEEPYADIPEELEGELESIVASADLTALLEGVGDGDGEVPVPVEEIEIQDRPPTAQTVGSWDPICPICLDPLENVIVGITPCRPVAHKFCYNCLTTALQQAYICPVCRKSITPQNIRIELADHVEEPAVIINFLYLKGEVITFQKKLEMLRNYGIITEDEKRVLSKLVLSKPEKNTLIN